MGKVVVLGGVVMDFIFEVPSWPLQGEAVQGRFKDVPGGKGLNQSVACARLNAETTIVSAVGDDNYGKTLKEILVGEGVYRHLSEHRRTGTDVTAVILPANSTAGFIGCRRATENLTSDFVQQEADESIKDADVVLVTFDASISAAEAVVAMAKKYHKKIIINPAPPMNMPINVINGIDFLIPNEWEAKEWLKIANICTESELSLMTYADIGHKFQELGVKTVIITLGSNGCVVIDRSNVREYSAYNVNVLDTTGASDAFCAAMAVMIAEGPRLTLSMEFSRISFASAAGAVACTRFGAYSSMPGRDEVTRFKENHTPLIIRKY